MTQQFKTSVHEKTREFVAWYREKHEELENFSIAKDTKAPYGYIPSFDGNAQKLFELKRPDNNNRREYLSKQFVLEIISEKIFDDFDNAWYEVIEFDATSDEFLDGWDISGTDEDLGDVLEDFSAMKERFMNETGWMYDAFIDLQKQWSDKGIEGFIWDW